MKKYRNIIEAIEDNLVSEGEKAGQLIRKLKPARQRNYLTREEFLDICHWKSPRSKKHYEKNRENTVKKITREAFSVPHEITKIKILDRLKGIGLPMASALLTMTYPQKYGIIDIRVWQCLYKYGLVTDNPKGINFSPEQWFKYLVKLRYIARKLKKTCRIIEYTMFEHHKKMIQRGNLYK